MLWSFVEKNSATRQPWFLQCEHDITTIQTFGNIRCGRAEMSHIHVPGPLADPQGRPPPTPGSPWPTTCHCSSGPPNTPAPRRYCSASPRTPPPAGSPGSRRPPPSRLLFPSRGVSPLHYGVPAFDGFGGWSWLAGATHHISHENGPSSTLRRHRVEKKYEKPG